MFDSFGFLRTRLVLLLKRLKNEWVTFSSDLYFDYVVDSGEVNDLFSSVVFGFEHIPQGQGPLLETSPSLWYCHGGWHCVVHSIGYLIGPRA